MQNCKDQKVWEKAYFFTLEVYDCTKVFPKEEIYCLTNQLGRYAASIPANIAEGCGKNSNQEFAHFLNIALGPANKSEYFLILSRDLKYLNENTYNTLLNIINEVKGMLIALINKVRS